MRPAWRYTVTSLKGGQERPYADHVNVYQVKFEHTDHVTGEWVPTTPMIEEAVRDYLRNLKCGFTDRVRPVPCSKWSEEYDTYLDYLREVEPGVWEFQTRARYTD